MCLGTVSEASQATSATGPRAADPVVDPVGDEYAAAFAVMQGTLAPAPLRIGRLDQFGPRGFQFGGLRE